MEPNLAKAGAGRLVYSEEIWRLIAMDYNNFYDMCILGLSGCRKAWFQRILAASPDVAPGNPDFRGVFDRQD